MAALRPMKDSTNWAAIPVGTPLVGGYVPPSRFAWPAQAWARFAGSICVRITPSASTHGAGIHVLDQENGDATPAQVPGWVLASRGAGQEPTVYTTYGTWAECIQACINAGVVVPQWWIADWNDVQDLPTIIVNGITYTAIAHQYADPATSGGDWDSSCVAAYWPGVDSNQTAPTPTYTTTTEDDMNQLVVPAGQDEHVTVIVDGCANLYLGSSYHDGVEILQLDWWGATPPQPAPAVGGIGGESTNWTVDDNRAGPVPIPAGSVSCSIRYNANHAWTVAAK